MQTLISKQIRDLPANGQALLAALVPAPQTLWAARDDLVPLDVWAVFETHEEVRLKLTDNR